jgi:class 3 adenylate cyclase
MSLRTENLVIVLTDIVGYTEASEQKSRRESEEFLGNYSAILLPIIKRFKGRLIKTIGDALLMVFKSPTDAMICAMAMQDAIFDFNRRIPSEKQIHIRVAASLGEVRVVKEDIFGDAVNVTSRIESITPSDEIYFSDAVYLAMNKAEVPAKEVGLKKLKGISSEVRVYQIPRFSTVVLVPQNVMGSEDIGQLTYPYGGAHFRGLPYSSSTIIGTITTLGAVLSSILSHRYAKVGLLAASALLVVALVVPRFWSDSDKPSKSPGVAREQTTIKTGILPGPGVVDSTGSSPSQPVAPSSAVVPSPTQISGRAETWQSAATTPATGSTGQTVPPEMPSLPLTIGEPQSADQQAAVASVPAGQSALPPAIEAQPAPTGLLSGSRPPESPTPAGPSPAASPAQTAPSPIPVPMSVPVPVAPTPETSVPAKKTRSARISPQKPKPKVDKSFEGKSLEANSPAVIAKVPPPPRHASITTFKEAKSAYAVHTITAEEYRMIVGRLKIAYAKEVEQLKLDYRLGKMDKTEYARRAAQIKEKYK